MKSFTSSKFAAKPGALYNEVQATGSAMIDHKSRPNMVVMTFDQLEKLLSSKIHREVFKEMQA